MSLSLCKHPRLSAANAFSLCSSFGRLALAPLVSRRGFKANRKATSKRDIFGTKHEENTEIIPEYPREPGHHAFHRSDSGLFGGKTVQYGNKISKGRNKGRTRRRWEPHVKLADLESKALGGIVTLKVTYACLRTIRKCGGLDEYLIKDKPSRIKELGKLGWTLRWQVMNSPVMRQRFAAERERLGLPPREAPVVPFEEAWEDEEYRAKLIGEEEQQWEKLAEADERFRKHVESKWEPKDGEEYRKPVMIPDFKVAARPALEDKKL